MPGTRPVSGTKAPSQRPAGLISHPICRLCSLPATRYVACVPSLCQQQEQSTIMFIGLMLLLRLVPYM